MFCSGVLLRQGMICPLDVIALLVGLQGDISEEIQRRTLRIIQLEDVKHSNFLDNRLCEGVELVPQLQMQARRQSWALLPTAAVAETKPPVSVMGTLYITCFRTNRKRRTDFLTSLLRRCDNYCNITGNINFTKPSERINLAKIESTVEFLATTLAYIPFSVQDEPLLVISWLNRNATVQTELFLKRFRNILISVGAVVRQDGAMQGPMEGSGLKRSGSATSDAAKAEGFMLEETLLFDEDSFQSHLKEEGGKLGAFTNMTLLRGYSCEARCRERLVLVKHFLKYAYSLSSSLCVAYSSDSKTVVDKSRRPKKRGSRVSKSTDAGEEPAAPSEGDESALLEETSIATVDFSASSKSGWNSSVTLSEYAINHPYLPITPKDGDSNADQESSPHTSRSIQPFSDNWANASPGHALSHDLRVTNNDVAIARQVIRKAMCDFNRLLTLHFNGFEHHVSKASSASSSTKRAKQNTDADTTAAKSSKQTKKRGLKRKRRNYDGSSSSEESDDDLLNDDA
jgi:hypothetical protein